MKYVGVVFESFEKEFQDSRETFSRHLESPFSFSFPFLGAIPVGLRPEPDPDLKQGFYKVSPAFHNGPDPDPNPDLTKLIVVNKPSHCVAVFFWIRTSSELTRSGRLNALYRNQFFLLISILCLEKNAI
jgi:hypothetical protein